MFWKRKHERLRSGVRSTWYFARCRPERYLDRTFGAGLNDISYDAYRLHLDTLTPSGHLLWHKLRVWNQASRTVTCSDSSTSASFIRENQESKRETRRRKHPCVSKIQSARLLADCASPQGTFDSSMMTVAIHIGSRSAPRILPLWRVCMVVANRMAQDRGFND